VTEISLRRNEISRVCRRSTKDVKLRFRRSGLRYDHETGQRIFNLNFTKDVKISVGHVPVYTLIGAHQCDVYEDPILPPNNYILQQYIIITYSDARNEIISYMNNK